VGGVAGLNLLLDTHIILWSASEPEKLPLRIAEELERPANALWYSPISVWEILLLAEKGRISIGKDIEKSVRHIFQGLPLKEAPVNIEVAIQSRNVDLPHQDPADRFLVATAMVYDLLLVTADRRIRAAKDLQVLDAS
jgi:PIN domain nuclease of toxin-antitoxin system